MKPPLFAHVHARFLATAEGATIDVVPDTRPSVRFSYHGLTVVSALVVLVALYGTGLPVPLLGLLTALAVVLGALGDRWVWHASLRWLAHEQVLGPWIEQTFEAIEVSGDRARPPSRVMQEQVWGDAPTSQAMRRPRAGWNRRFVTDLSVNECRARAWRAFAVLRTTRWQPSWRWSRASGQLTYDGFEMRLPVIPGRFGSVLAFPGVRATLTPTPDETRIDIWPDNTWLGDVGLWMVVPPVVASVAFKGLDQWLSGPVGWGLIAVAGLAGGLIGRQLWRLSQERLREDERLEPWIAQTFEAVEVPIGPETHHPESPHGSGKEQP
jgi:hypothetical protein